MASPDKNENIDLWLTVGDKHVMKVLKHGMTLIAIFSKQVKSKESGGDSGTNKLKKVAPTTLSMQDFDKMKVIGKGGFAEKVYLARKKDTGSLYAIKTMSKAFIMEE